MTLTDKEISLELTSDFRYLTGMIRENPYNILNDRGIARFLTSVRYCFVGRVSGNLGGVVFFCHHEDSDRWTLDAYKDDQKLKILDNKGNFSYRAGVLAIDWFSKQGLTKMLYTMHEKENRGATIVCRKLGFKKVGDQNGFIVLAREV